MKRSLTVVAVLFVMLFVIDNADLLLDDDIKRIMGKLKPNQIQQFKISERRLLDVIPKNIERQKIEDYVIKACEFYTKHLRQKDRDSR